MPVYLSIDELSPGMTLARNINNKFNMVLSKGHRLTDQDIAGLRRHYPNMMIHVGDPILDEFTSFQDDSNNFEVAYNVHTEISQVAQKVNYALRDKTMLSMENVQGVNKAVKDMMGYIASTKVSHAVMNQITSSDQYFQEHSANVFYLSVIIGNTLSNYIKKERQKFSRAKQVKDPFNMTPLAMASMLCDIGMIPLQEIRTKTDPLTDKEIELIKNHPFDGADMLPDEMDPMIKLAIRGHHENMDGSGYPRNLLGDQINIFSRIIRVADAYSAATAEKVFSDARSPIRVLFEMVTEPFCGFYDPAILRVLFRILQPFPIGAKLKMSTGQTAVVVRHQLNNPFDPVVILAYDAMDEKISSENLERPFKLSEKPLLHLVSFGDEDISYLNNVVVDFGKMEANSDETQNSESAMLASIIPQRKDEPEEVGEDGEAIQSMALPFNLLYP